MKIDNNLNPTIGKGGIESITLFNVEDIKSVEYNRNNNSFFNIQFNDNSRKITIPVSRGAAEYSEKTENRSGMLWVGHNLIFSLEGVDSQINSEIRELVKYSENGVAAIVNTKHGAKILVGYSKKLMQESALRAVSVELTSATMPYDAPCETWKLSSVDGEKAKVLVEIP